MENNPEKLLLLAKKRISSLIASLPVGIAVLASDGTIEAVNAAFSAIFGYDSGSDLIGNNSARLFRQAPWLRLGTVKNWFQSSAEPVETEGWTADGEIVRVEVSLRQYETDGPERWLLITQDVTERFIANQVKQEFLQMITHDIRSPLTAVQVFLESLESDALGSKADRIKYAKNNIKRLLRLTSEILDLDQLSNNKLNIHKEQIDLNAVVREAIESILELAEEKSISIAYKPQDFLITVDRGRLVQVLVSLLTNAIGHALVGQKITIAAKEVESSMLQLSISDEGPGIPKGECAIIFERFRQGRSGKRSGFGLGLAICKQIIDLHDGKIGCESDGKSGATFWLTVPLGTGAISNPNGELN